jgi:hypothetical protein
MPRSGRRVTVILEAITTSLMRLDLVDFCPTSHDRKISMRIDRLECSNPLNNLLDDTTPVQRG